VNPYGREDLVAVIMAGGSGTRFWPLSDGERPKQFLKLFGDRTMLQQTYDRLRGLVPPERTLVLTNRRFVATVRSQLPEVPPENIVGEPVARDTAAAVALGAVICRRRFGNPVMVVLPADHLIRPVEVFQRAVLSAARAARGGQGSKLYTFGIVPTYPATGYGYLSCGEKVSDDGIEHYRLLQFREKPDQKTAEAYLEAGNFFWNSGIFVWTADSILEEVARHLPQLAQGLLRAAEYYGTGRWDAVLRSVFNALPKVSIDYGVMEKAAAVFMVRAQFQWDDIGSWAALAKYLERGKAGNVVRGQLECLDASNNLVFCEDEREIMALIGVQDLVVVRCKGKTLIVHRSRAEDVKKIVENMREMSREVGAG